MGAHAEQELLVGLAGAVEADVGERRGGEQAAQRVERLGLDRLAVDEVAVVRVLGILGRHPRTHEGQQLPVGVEHAVEATDVARPVRRFEDLGGAEVPVVAALQPVVVGDVAGRLLEVGHEPAPLENLGEHVGGLLACQVHPAQLRHGVVAVLDEDLLVEPLGPFEPDGGIERDVTGDVEVADELVEKEPPEALGRARVPRRTGLP